MIINLSHGNGAKETSELIESVFLRAFRNRWNEPMEDAARLDVGGSGLVFTTDSYVVKPLFFFGGDIGRLAVCGTVNDLLTTGGKPLFLSASFIIEEGMDTDTLAAVADSMQQAAREAGVAIVTGDTKVIEGNGGLYVNTAGVGLAGDTVLGASLVSEGDAILVSGTLGDHHACILSARMGIQNHIQSDAAPLCGLVDALSGGAVRCMRDITRGGLATVLNEVAHRCGLDAVIDEQALPVDPEVAGLCGILGLDPLTMGNEGKMLVIVPQDYAGQALAAIQGAEYGKNARIIGGFAKAARDPRVVLRTKVGGRRLVAPLSGEGLPRIC